MRNLGQLETTLDVICIAASTKKVFSLPHRHDTFLTVEVSPLLPLPCQVRARAHVPILPSIMRMAGHFLVYPTRLSWYKGSLQWQSKQAEEEGEGGHSSRVSAAVFAPLRAQV